MPAYPCVLEGNVIIRHGGLFMPNEGSVKLPVGTVIASADELDPGSGCIFQVTGTTAITKIKVAAAETGRLIILQFRGTLAGTGFTDGNNLKLAGNFAADVDDTIMLLCVDGTNWFELSRSAN